ncbi:MAG: FeoB-associated Cys-rich membrane protein [Acetatifactor sp.]|nr:FeoB-associated Cys-rich membrane protein [Acetatifactor sp.]
MGTFFVGAILVIVVGLIIRGMIKDKKSGKSSICRCGGNCNACGNDCHSKQ